MARRPKMPTGAKFPPGVIRMIQQENERKAKDFKKIADQIKSFMGILPGGRGFSYGTSMVSEVIERLVSRRHNRGDTPQVSVEEFDRIRDNPRFNPVVQLLLGKEEPRNPYRNRAGNTDARTQFLDEPSFFDPERLRPGSLDLGVVEKGKDSDFEDLFSDVKSDKRMQDTLQKSFHRLMHTRKSEKRDRNKAFHSGNFMDQEDANFTKHDRVVSKDRLRQDIYHTLGEGTRGSGKFGEDVDSHLRRELIRRFIRPAADAARKELGP